MQHILTVTIEAIAIAFPLWMAVQFASYAKSQSRKPRTIEDLDLEIQGEPLSIDVAAWEEVEEAEETVEPLTLDEQIKQQAQEAVSAYLAAYPQSQPEPIQIKALPPASQYFVEDTGVQHLPITEQTPIRLLKKLASDLKIAKYSRLTQADLYRKIVAEVQAR